MSQPQIADVAQNNEVVIEGVVYCFNNPTSVRDFNLWLRLWREMSDAPKIRWLITLHTKDLQNHRNFPAQRVYGALLVQHG